MITEILKIIGPLVQLLANDTGRGHRKNLRMYRKYRRKLFKEFKKDGFTEEETRILEKIDTTYIESLLKLGKF